jgi:hypothetical protein
MTSLFSLAGDHLSGIGFAPSLLGGLAANPNTPDILKMAVRVALIGLCATAVRVIFGRVKTSIMESELTGEADC